MMKLGDLANSLLVIDAKLTEASAEIIAKISALETALSDTPIPDEAADLLSQIEQSANALADIVPNV